LYHLDQWYPPTFCVARYKFSSKRKYSKKSKTIFVHFIIVMIVIQLKKYVYLVARSKMIAYQSGTPNKKCWVSLVYSNPHWKIRLIRSFVSNKRCDPIKTFMQPSNIRTYISSLKNISNQFLPEKKFKFFKVS